MIISIILLLTLAFAGCSNDPVTKVGNLVIVEDIQVQEGEYGDFYYTGKIENKGNNTVYNASIQFKIYETSAKETIIDNTWDYLADGENIAPGEQVYIETYKTDSVNNIEQMNYYNHNIDWIER